jgi:hypothetical protein
LQWPGTTRCQGAEFVQVRISPPDLIHVNPDNLGNSAFQRNNSPSKDHRIFLMVATPTTEIHHDERRLEQGIYSAIKRNGPVNVRKTAEPGFRVEDSFV